MARQDSHAKGKVSDFLERDEKSHYTLAPMSSRRTRMWAWNHCSEKCCFSKKNIYIRTAISFVLFPTFQRENTYSEKNVICNSVSFSCHNCHYHHPRTTSEPDVYIHLAGKGYEIISKEESENHDIFYVHHPSR